ncbi:MAG: helix-turn-helix domain-containing protein [Bacteroidales bacterium]|nr:helix-turn-helix domain-containing protein [Bacteroidales bacterium]
MTTGVLPSELCCVKSDPMEVLDILDDVQRCLNGLQHKIDLVRLSVTGKAYDVDVLMTRKEAAAFLGKSERQLDRLTEEGRIKRFIVEGQIRFRKSNLLAYKALLWRSTRRCSRWSPNCPS